MVDRYQQLTETPPGRFVAKRLGIPQPARLRRYERGEPAVAGRVLLGGAPGGRLVTPIARILAALDADVWVKERGETQDGASAGGLETTVWNAQGEDEDTRFAALVFDASGIGASDELAALHGFFHPVARRVERSGRVLVFATPPELSASSRQAVAQRALEGFTRSFGKEVGRGATVQLVYVAPEAESRIESSVRFFLSGKSAYVSGQVVRVGAGAAEEPGDWERPLEDKVAVVTGAARGIGAAIAETLARDGAHVVCVDIPAQGSDLAAVANDVGGSALQLDISSADAPATLSDYLRERHDGVDVVVHNAGVTRDRTIGRMDEERWQTVIEINLAGPEHVTEALVDGPLRPGGRIVCMSSVSGIAGNRGQTNYATSKAGLIGLVTALAPTLASKPATINAVAPGFIQTPMTAAMPVATREAGRRLNSLAQGGLPIDVAETVAWLASPGSGGVNGNVVRVCGQSLLGA